MKNLRYSVGRRKHEGPSTPSLLPKVVFLFHVIFVNQNSERLSYAAAESARLERPGYCAAQVSPTPFPRVTRHLVVIPFYLEYAGSCGRLAAQRGDNSSIHSLNATTAS